MKNSDGAVSRRNRKRKSGRTFAVEHVAIPALEQDSVSPRKLRRANDPIPVEALLLEDAFHQVIDAVLENPECARDEFECWQEILLRNLESCEEDCRPHGLTVELAALVLRTGLCEGLNSYVRDPVHNAILRLDGAGWCQRLAPPHPDAKIYLFGNWIDPEFMPGPSGTEIAGALRPIFVLKSELATWLANLCGSKESYGFRSGSYDKADAPVVLKMREAVQTGKCKSARDAARKYVSMASGSGTIDSITTRLIRAYYRTYPK